MFLGNYWSCSISVTLSKSHPLSLTYTQHSCLYTQTHGSFKHVIIKLILNLTYSTSFENNSYLVPIPEFTTSPTRFLLTKYFYLCIFFYKYNGKYTITASAQRIIYCIHAIHIQNTVY